MPEQTQRETWVRYVMDIACVRKSPSDELLGRASTHMTECALMGHCVESGFAPVDDDGHVHLLEPAATTAVIRELLGSHRAAGIRLRAVRERDGEETSTVDVHPVSTRGEA